MSDWAKFAGFAAFLIVALGGSLLWALDYAPQNSEWTCKSQSDPNEPNNRALNTLVCHPAQSGDLHQHSTAANANREENGGGGTKITDRLLALFTGLLVLVGAAQGYYLWNASNATRESVKVAERALTELEAPFLSIKIVKTGIDMRATESTFTFGVIHFRMSNHGRTPARIIELADRFFLHAKNDGLPPDVHPQSATRNTMPYGVIAPPNGESQDWTNNIFGFLMGALAKDPQPLKTQNLFFYGFVRYATIFDEVYRMGFCFMFDVIGERWLLQGGDKYNYRRKESGTTP